MSVTVLPSGKTTFSQSKILVRLSIVSRLGTIPPFVHDHCPHGFCWGGGIAVRSMDLIDGNLRGQTPSHKSRYGFPNHMSAIIFVCVGFAIPLINGVLFGRFSDIDPELVILPEHQHRARIVGQGGRQDLLQRGEPTLVRLITCKRHTSAIQRLWSSRYRSRSRFAHLSCARIPL